MYINDSASAFKYLIVLKFKKKRRSDPEREVFRVKIIL